jgi:hypothetical protein
VHRSLICVVAALICVGSLTLSFGAGATIGIAMVSGIAKVDNSDVRGNASLLDGSLVETGKGTSRLSLQNGARVEFSSESRGKVYRDRVVLEKGMGQLHAGSNFPVVANSLRVAAMGSGSTVRVAVKDSNRILVAAVSGEAQVRNSHGLLLAKVMPGNTLEFDQEVQAGAAAPVKITGCVGYKEGSFALRDDVTNVIYEIKGPGADALVGKHVTITGSVDPNTPPVAGAEQVVRFGAGGSSPVSGGCPSGTGAGGGAAAGAAGLSHAAVVVIVAGVVIAGVLGGLAAAGSFDTGTQSP